MKTNRSEYQTQQEIIRGFKTRRMVKIPHGRAWAINLLIWLAVGFAVPFALLGIISHYHQSGCHSKALAIAGNVGTDHYHSELEKCSK